MLLAFLIPRCSSGCSTQVLKFPIWESPLDPAWVIGTGVLGCRVTFFSSYGWETWIYRSPLKHLQTKIKFKISEHFLTSFWIVLLLIYSMNKLKLVLLKYKLNNKITVVGRKNSNNNFHPNLLATGEIKKSFVLSDDKGDKMSSSSLQIKRWVSISATYSQRVLERFGTLHTWAKVHLRLHITSSTTYYIFNWMYHHFLLFARKQPIHPLSKLLIVPGKLVNLVAWYLLINYHGGSHY